MIWAFFVLCCGFLLLNEIYRNKKGIKESLEQIQSEYGKEPSTKVKRSISTCEKAFASLNIEEKFFIDDITWRDLAMSKIFERMNYTFSAAGAEVLYQILRIPSYDEAELKKRADIIQKLEKDKDLRTNLNLHLKKIGFTGKYALTEYLSYLDKLRPENSMLYYGMDLLYLLAIIVIYKLPVLGIVFLFLVLFLNIRLYFKKKAILSPYLVSFAYILRMLHNIEDIVGADLPGIDEEFADLKSKTKELKRFKRFSTLAMSMQNPTTSSNPLDLLGDYLKIMFHFDLIKFQQMLRECQKKRSIIEKMAYQIGYLDAMQSIASYRESLRSYCQPDFVRTEQVIDFLEIRHPLLKNAVCNSLTTYSNVLLTGSNASGKSTFLKAIALNTIFAQSIVTCTARKWRSCFYRVYTSMALQDDIVAGESYYMAEIKSLKRILDAAENKNLSPVLGVVDEVLRGTNTIERIAASSQVLKSLFHLNMICFAATHDIELTLLLHPWYENYHFEEEMLEGRVSFSYELKSGRATSRNAIKLLKEIGYDKTVMDKAEKMASDFLTDGKWHLDEYTNLDNIEKQQE